MKANIFWLSLLAVAFSFSCISCGDDDEKIESGDDSGIEVNSSSNGVKIQVPNEGGQYTVTVDLNDKVHIKTKEVISFKDFSYNIYDYENKESLSEVQYECSLVKKQLKITVKPLNSLADRTASIILANEDEETVASVELVQEGRDTPLDVERPLLGSLGVNVVNSVKTSMMKAYTYLSLIEQDNLNHSELTPASAFVDEAWKGFYAANNSLLTLKSHDEGMLNAYGDYCQLLCAMNYTTLATYWGNVPYYNVFNGDVTDNSDFTQRPHTEILADLKVRLNDLMGRLEEKVNRPFGDANAFFFASRDVARMVLANIYMFEGDYAAAKPLLEEVMANNYYQLEASTEYTETSSELIFALQVETVKGYPDYQMPTLIPCFTLSDTYLSLAECQYHMGDEPTALQSLQQVADVKGLDLPDAAFLTQLQQVRERLLLHSGNYFTFLKRNGLAIDRCGIEEYRLWLPIPSSFMKDMAGVAVQNEGY